MTEVRMFSHLKQVRNIRLLFTHLSTIPLEKSFRVTQNSCVSFHRAKMVVTGFN